MKETGEVITFEGIYAADKGQAAAVTFYTFCGEGLYLNLFFKAQLTSMLFTRCYAAAS